MLLCSDFREISDELHEIHEIAHQISLKTRRENTEIYTISSTFITQFSVYFISLLFLTGTGEKFLIRNSPPSLPCFPEFRS